MACPPVDVRRNNLPRGLLVPRSREASGGALQFGSFGAEFGLLVRKRALWALAESGKLGFRQFAVFVQFDRLRQQIFGRAKLHAGLQAVRSSQFPCDVASLTTGLPQLELPL